jgi:hypothetical protein
MPTTFPASNIPVRLVFVERGPDLPKALPRDEVCDLIVLADAALGASAREAIRSIARLERSGQNIAHADILVGGQNASTTVERLEQRTTLAVALVRHMARAGSGELTFVADATSSRSLRSELLALVDTLLTTMGSPGIGLRVQFRAPEGQPA